MTNTASKTSIWENGLIWFGAALSIAEIQTGTFFAPLGLEKGLMAILLGHLIGCGLLFGAGVIGGRTGKSAMETVKLSFGAKGSSAPEAIPFLSYVYANKKFTISTYLQYWYSTSLHDRLSESAIFHLTFLRR